MYKVYEEKILTKLQNVELQIFKEFIRICNDNKLNYFVAFGTAIGAVRHNGFIPWDDDIDVGMLREDYEKFIDIVNSKQDYQYEILTPFTDKRYACTVTHFQKKKTKFVPENSKYLKCNLGITIDIFVFDNIADDEKVRKKQVRKAWFLGRLLFLRGTAYPEIPYKGIKKMMAQIICYIAHYFLIIMGITSTKIYSELRKVSTRYVDTKYIACLEDPDPYGSMIKREDLFPLVKIKFEGIDVFLPNKYDELLTNQYGEYMELPPIEKRINHCPYILDFGEE